MNTHMIAHVVRSNIPCLTQFGQTGGLGPLFQSGIHMITAAEHVTLNTV